MLQFQQIRCFVALAHELHFGRAAERLNMTQPPFSRQIRLLETVVGKPLFERDHRRVTLTEAGARFLPEAEHLLRCSEGAVLAAQSAFRGLTGQVVLGYVMGVSFGLLPEVIAVVAERLPGVKLDLREISSDAQREALRSGGVDIALARSSVPTPDLGAVRVLREKFWAALPVGHALCESRLIDPHQLHDQPLFMYQPGRADQFYNILHGYFTGIDVEPRYVQYVRHGHSMLPLVDAGLGMALVPSSLRRMRYAGVAWRPILLPDAVDVETHMAWRLSDDRDNPVVSETRRLVLEAAASEALLEARMTATATEPARG